MNQADKDARAEKVIKSVINNFLEEDNVRRIVVRAIDDYSGDPSFYVNIHLKRADQLPSIEQRSKLRDALRQELAVLEDNRFPYITIISSYWEAEPNGERKSA